MDAYDRSTGPATDTYQDESVSQLIRDLRDESIILIRQQIELAKAETSEKISTAAKNTASLSAGALVAYAGVLFLLAALDFLIAYGFVSAGFSLLTSMLFASLIVGVVVGIIGYAMIRSSVNTFKKMSVVPEKTIHSLKEDKQWLTKKRP